ncbi:ribonuclease HII [Achromatium sp. WMS2]|nr:ribonuclease HII [Achromatium sp. WMS2]
MNLQHTDVGGLIAGVDEAGRGPLAGPVIAAAVILDPKHTIAGITDSKQLSAKRRDHLYQSICKHALAYAIGRAEVIEIENINILQASMLAMQRAVLALQLKPDLVLVDGNRCPDIPYPVQAVVQGDRNIVAIGAASILAKVTRDREMIALDQQFPGYGFAVHKGYPTKAHLDNLRKLGVSSVHRKTFSPVRALLK